MTAIIRAAMHDEYVRLCERRAALSVLKERIKAEEPIVEKRLAALKAAMTAFGREDDHFTADTHIADAYRLGLPLDFMLVVLNDNWVQDDESEWTEDAIKKRAHELGVRRPAGWTEAKADADWSAADIEDDDWLDRPFGLPDPTVALDKPAPLLMLEAPTPKPVRIIPDPAPETPPVAQEGACIIHAPSPEPARSAVEPPAKKLTGAKIPLDQRQKTPERVALLKNIWFTDRTREQIVNELSMLPGAPVRMDNLGQYVIQWGICTTATEVHRRKVLAERKALAHAAAVVLNAPDPRKPETISAVPTAPPVAPTPAAIPAEIPAVKAPPQMPRQNGTSLGDLVRQIAKETPAAPPVPAPKPNLATPPAAKATVQGNAAASGEPVVASAEYIIKWATDRGISGRNAAAMLDQVNARARKLGLRPFAIAGKI